MLPLHNLAGEQSQQQLIIVDKKGNRLGGTATREKCHSGAGITHLAFMAFLFDSYDNLILTKRSKHKSLWESFWDASVVSHILKSETSQVAAARRCQEELGIAAKFKKIGAFYYFASFGDQSENEYCYVLTGTTIKTPCPNPVEIEEIRKLTIDELNNEIARKREKFTPWLIIALKKYFPQKL